MKTALILSFIIIAIFVALQAFSSMNTNSVEKQKYIVLKKSNDFEIRSYNEAIIASVKLKGNYEEISGDGFRVLAGYIFGKNHQDVKIAMTSPVYMDFADSVTTMSFVMPSEYKKEDLPAPVDERVSIEDLNNGIVAVLSFGGYASTQKINDKIDELKHYLKVEKLEYFGNFKFLGYNPPFQVLNRRNEIMVQIKYQAETKH